MTMHRLLTAVFAAFALIISAGVASAYEWNNDTDRPGYDFTNFTLSDDHPMRQAHQCRTACENSGAQCRAWTLVRRGIQGPQARCWLKYAVPAPYPNTCCISGVK